MIMPANHRSGVVHYLAGARPGSIGLLFSPRGWSNPPYYMPYALDNGCFKQWEPELFRVMLKKTGLQRHDPLWVVVPDVVGDAESTLKLWHEWKTKIPFRLAFACQDGMEPNDVPKEAHCCFIGGSTDWKWNNADKFKGVATLLHIARVNTENKIKFAKYIGADSVDGTGFFKNKRQTQDMIDFIEGSKQMKLC